MKKRVLVVDDSSMMRKIINKTFDQLGCEIVGQACNGHEALELYKSLNPDFVTMDITMRGMDGFTAAEEILKFDDKANILFLSNMENERYRKKAESINCMGMVQKHQTKEIEALIIGLE